MLKKGRNAYVILLKPPELMHCMKPNGKVDYHNPIPNADPVQRALDNNEIFVGWPRLDLPLPAAMKWDKQRLKVYAQRVNHKQSVNYVVTCVHWFLNFRTGDYIFVRVPDKKVIVGEIIDGDVTVVEEVHCGQKMKMIHSRPVKWLYPEGILCPYVLRAALFTRKTYGGKSRPHLICMTNDLLNETPWWRRWWKSLWGIFCILRNYWRSMFPPVQG